MIVRTRWTDPATSVTHEVVLNLPPAQYSRHLAKHGGDFNAKPEAGLETACGVTLAGRLRLNPWRRITCPGACGTAAPVTIRRAGPKPEPIAAGLRRCA